MVPRIGNKRGMRKMEELQGDESLLGSDGLANETRTLDPSDSRIGHGRFRTRPSDDQEESCLPGEKSKSGQKC